MSERRPPPPPPRNPPPPPPRKPPPPPPANAAPPPPRPAKLGAPPPRGPTLARPRADCAAAALPDAVSAARSILSRTKHRLPIAAAEIHPIRSAGLQIAVAEALLNVRVVVSHALAMRGVVLPVVPDIVGPVVVVDVEVAVAPVASAAPVIAPASDGPARTEGETRRDHARADIGRVTEVIGLIVRIGPGSVNRRRIVVRHVHRIGIGRLDDDRLLAFLRLNPDLLLPGGDQLLVVIGLGAQALDRVHHIRLLCQHGIAQVLGPVDLVAHHRNDVCGARERLDAVVPGLFLDLFLQCIALQGLARFEPAIGLHHFQRIGRRRQYICQQFVWIQRNRRNQRLELLGLQQLYRRRRLARRLRRTAGSRWIVGRLCRDSDRDRHQQREREQGLAAAEHHTTLLWASIAASIGPRWRRSLIKIKETQR